MRAAKSRQGKIHLPKLPALLNRKIYKTGQTRGADDDEIYQNRVGRNGTVLIPFEIWRAYFGNNKSATPFENSFIVLVSPDFYFSNLKAESILYDCGLTVGVNALVFYETRVQWQTNNPEKLGWRAPTSRIAPLNGKYVARIPATTSNTDGERIVRGFDTTSNKGAGIRVYEYASKEVITQCRDQLEALFWLCRDSSIVAAENGMTDSDIDLRMSGKLRACQADGLLDLDRLAAARILNSEGHTICPLCLEELSSRGFFSRMEQAEGRAVLDLTITQINLFHIEELRMGGFNHRPYNLGWGHHHCNVVVKDSGIINTLKWMHGVLEKNIVDGHFDPQKRGNS